MTRQPHDKDPIVEVRIGAYCNHVHQATLFGDIPLKLKTGETLDNVLVAYETWGSLNEDASNAVLLVHALTGDSHAACHGPDDRPGWFEGMIGQNKALDPEKYYIICSNWLGSNYGSTGPTSENPQTGQPFDTTFPGLAIDDMSRVQKALSDHLGIDRFAAVIGGSVGGMIVLDFAARFPRSLARAIPIATAFRASPWVIAFHEIMRRILSIGHDSGDEELKRRALEVARMVGIVTYRSHREFSSRYRRARAELSWQDEGCCFAVESYLRHQGKKLDERFDPTTYEYLTRSADLFDLGEIHGSLDQALARIQCRVLALGIDSDHLFPLEEQQEIVDKLKENHRIAELGVVHSDNGHDGFLIEFDQMNALIGAFLQREE